jgi:hypothetical protein
MSSLVFRKFSPSSSKVVDLDCGKPMTMKDRSLRLQMSTLEPEYPWCLMILRGTKWKRAMVVASFCLA